MVQQDENHGKTIALSDGRQLGYIERGTSDENMIFFFHGWPSSRLELLQTESFTSYSDVRIISIDRPGIGLSDYQAKRKVLDIADDIVELADTLGVEKFSIIGFSGGATYAHACSLRIPERLNSVGIVSGIGPYYVVKRHSSWSVRLMLSLGRMIPSLIRNHVDSVYAIPLKSEEQENAKKQMLDNWKMNLPDSDKKILEQPGVFNTVWKQMQDVFTNGVEGAALDGLLVAGNWGFKLSDIPEDVEIYLWHGEADLNVSVEIGRSVAGELAHCKTKFYPEEGHYSLLLNNFDEIVRTLVNS